MKLQIAIDLLDAKGTLELSEKVKDVVDIVEVGTPVIMLEGLHAVRALRNASPSLKILADTKIVDGAQLETEYAVDAGADIITVLGISQDITIQECIETAHKFNREVLVDLIHVDNVAERAMQIDKMHADYISVHTASDIQSHLNNPLDDLKKISKIVKHTKIACAGGINLETLQPIMELNPELIIVGSNITQSEDPYKAALKYHQKIKGVE